MKAVIFTSPSLSHEEAKKIFAQAEYRAPIKRGDALRALKEGARILGIIDGVFHQDVAISPREILEVIREGVKVVGGGSIGALRASELHELGMIGVGEIFRMFKDCELESDDEVAVVVNPETFEALSEPLVNIRATLSALVSKRLIDEDLRIELLEIAKGMHYSMRNYDSIVLKAVEKGIIPEKEADRLILLLESNKINLKKLDAIKVVEKVKEIYLMAEKL
ncbi:MAG: TfuA-related McrA-glycine thioamidation protein [Archaeoglobaceae archaeon]|nr:TfuA-related McrA-glycine thioamidation protein [Archaeoglobaceae archaeon]MDW8128179.1 TfuA-related McrA-glycine thioamidation protein [Archaeoglobaceae archaeon]